MSDLMSLCKIFLECMNAIAFKISYHVCLNSSRDSLDFNFRARVGAVSDVLPIGRHKYSIKVTLSPSNPKKYGKLLFVKFVVCQNCHKLYTYDQAQIVVHGKKQSKLCDFVQYSNHPQVRMRSPRGATLMKVVVSKDGNKQSLYPFRTYCYQSLKISLQRLLQRQDVRKALARNIIQHEGAYFDIYDGKVWRQFKDPHGHLYFNDRRNLAGMFNIDWFQPFEGSEHSLGAMYMVLLNLQKRNEI